MPQRIPPELGDELLRIADRLAMGLEGDADDLVRLGSDMLVAGMEGEAIVALASFGWGERWVDVEPVAREALVEAGVELPGPEDAGWALALYWARQLKLGGSGTYQRASALWGLWWQLGQPHEVAQLVEVMDAWEEALPGAKDEAETELQTLADPIIALAERHLTPG